MVRRGCDLDSAPSSEPPKKRNRTASDSHVLNTSVNIDQPLPPGVVLTDVSQKEWRIGKPIGCGSFGQIYLASDDVSSEVTRDTARYVLKVEPHSNGPLFVELHCLIRTAKHGMIRSWQQQKQLKSLGMPHFIANGSHILGDTRYRFLVLPRYATDLQKLSRTLQFGRIHPRNVLVLAAQIIDVLEYLHTKGYTHSDIKSSNLMIGFRGDAFKDQRTCRYMLPPETSNCESIASESSKKSAKSSKNSCTYSGYYEDKDFELNNYSDSSEFEESDCEINRTSQRKKITSKKLRAKKIFNLRKHKSSVNYGDENSSICSDSSHLRSMNSASKGDVYSSDEGYHEGARSKRCSESNDEEVDYFEESILTQSSGQVYLLDYGLASKFLNSDGTHKEFGMDQRKAHDGTLEYSSRDSHIGAHSRRSDLENLGFNLLDWLTGGLPWKTAHIMEKPDLVHAVKKNYMEDTKKFVEACFKTNSYPPFIEKYLDYVNKLEFTQKPDYAYCRSLFVNEFVSCNFGTEKDMELNFSKESNTAPQKKKNYSKKIGRNKTLKNTSPDFLKRNGVVKPSGRENFIMNSWENNLKMDLLREGLNLSNDGNRKPCTSRNFYVSDAVLISKLRQSLLPVMETPSKKFSPKNLRSKKVTGKKRKGAKNKRSSIGKFGNFLGSGKQYTWAEILAGNPEDIIRKVDKEKTCDASSEAKNPRSRKVSNASEISLVNDVNASPNLLRKDFLANRNPTYAMKQVVAQYRRKTSGKAVKLDFVDETDGDSNESGYTYAMIMVLKNKEKRLKREKDERIVEELPLRRCRIKNLTNVTVRKGAKNAKVKVSSSKILSSGSPNLSSPKVKIVSNKSVSDKCSVLDCEIQEAKSRKPVVVLSRRCSRGSARPGPEAPRAAATCRQSARRANQPAEKKTEDNVQVTKKGEKRTPVKKIASVSKTPLTNCSKSSPATSPGSAAATPIVRSKPRPARVIATRSKMLRRI